MVLSILTGAIFGILPALRSSRLSPALVMKEEAGSVSGGSHKSRISNLLVVAQIVLSMLLLICAGLFVRSLQNAQRLNPGFDPDHVLLSTFDLLPAGYSEEKGIEFDRQLLSRLAALPGVEAVTLADSVPLCFNNHSSIIAPEGYVPQLHESMEVGRAYVGPDYLRTMRIPLVSGRDLTAKDSVKSQPVALINQALAERYWPGQEAIGKQIRVEGISWTIVGVAHNSLWANLDNKPRPLLFIPLSQDYYHEAIIHVRVSGDPQAFASTVANTIHEMDPGLPIYDVATLRARTQVASFLGRIAVTMVGAFGMIALVLAAVGIYGVISHSTRQRTREIGIRVAIGAGPGAILRQVLVHGLRLAITGLVLGIALSMVLTRFLRSELVGIEATDAPTYFSVSMILCIVALAASYVPARRASRIDPMVALRYE
jgi:predicted permease